MTQRTEHKPVDLARCIYQLWLDLDGGEHWMINGTDVDDVALADDSVSFIMADGKSIYGVPYGIQILSGGGLYITGNNGWRVHVSRMVSVPFTHKELTDALDP